MSEFGFLYLKENLQMPNILTTIINQLSQNNSIVILLARGLNE